MSWASTPGSRKSMQGNRSRDTGPELAVRRRLHASGFRYRVDYRPDKASRSRADIVFTRQAVAVFIDGCFWHGCPEHQTLPARNADYWGPKLARNVERDREVSELLGARGWLVLRFWEHEDPDEVADVIAATVRVRFEQHGAKA